MEKVNKILDEKRDEIINQLISSLKKIDPELEIDQIRFTKEKKFRCRWVRRKYTYNGKTWTKLVRVCR